MEHAADNIDVTMICPGPVKTNIMDALVKKDGKLPVSTKIITLNLH